MPCFLIYKTRFHVPKNIGRKLQIASKEIKGERVIFEFSAMDKSGVTQSLKTPRS